MEHTNLLDRVDRFEARRAARGAVHAALSTPEDSPAAPFDLDAYRARRRARVDAPELYVSEVNDLGLEDGRVYLVLPSTDGTASRWPLTPDAAQVLSANLQVSARAAARRSAGVLELRRVRRNGALAAGHAPTLCRLVESRGPVALLEIVETGARAWYSTQTGETVHRDLRRAYLRLSMRDAHYLRTLECEGSIAPAQSFSPPARLGRETTD